MQALRSSVLGESSRRQNKCHKHGAYNTLYIVIAIIPFWMRFLQCIRRLYEEKDLKHLCNGLKYLSTIVAVILRHKGKTSWMVLDVILRLAWMQLVLEFRLPALHKMTVTTIYGCLEIVRRGMWSFFRVENEHLNNVGHYRAFKSVPLPFSYNEEDD